MIKGSVGKIETLGLVDGPGVRVVIFLSGCKLRCKYCHNPEFWNISEFNYTPEELTREILKYKEYFGSYGGVTFSGGEALIQDEFLIETCKLLKKDNINIALDTAGVGNGNYEEVLKYVDLVILDIKEIDKEKYKKLTGKGIDESLKFIKEAQRLNKKLWIRQVIITNYNDNEEYIKDLANYLKTLKNIEKIEFLPFHNLAETKYEKLNINYPYKNKKAMDKEKCEKLYKKFIKYYKN